MRRRLSRRSRRRRRGAPRRRLADQKLAEERRRAATAEAQKNTMRTIVLTPEPIPRPAPERRPVVSSAPPMVHRPHFYRRTAYRLRHGTAVKRWFWRANGGHC